MPAKAKPGFEKGVSYLIQFITFALITHSGVYYQINYHRLQIKPLGITNPCDRFGRTSQGFL